MTPRTALLAVLLLTPCAAQAVVDPAPGAKDSRVRSVAYDQAQVIRLTSTGLSPLQLILDIGEKPLTVAGALVILDPKEAKDWFAKSSGNVLILQPLHSMEPTMLFVRTTLADGRDRNYSLELHTREGNVADATDRAAYMTVTFRYAPAPPTPEAIAAWRARRDVAMAARSEFQANARLASAQSAPRRNYAYDKRDPKGCPDLAPSYVFDDGNRTTLIFPPHAVLPQLYVVNSDGKEAIMTTINEATPNGLQVLMPSVSREMRLRRGGKVCAVRNNAFDPIGTEPGGGSGTVSPSVVRRVRAP